MFYPRTVTCLLALLASPILSSRATIPKTTKAPCRVTQFADFSKIDGAFIDGAFIVIRGFLGPDKFFKDLQCVDSPENTVFMNDAGKALTFPDRVTITLFIVGPVPLSEFAQPKRLDAEHMLNLRFSANWKRGVKIRPVKVFRELTASETQPPDFAVPLNVRQCWIYEFAVEDTSVPLTDHLILCIFSPENKRLARLSAHL